MPVSNSQAQGVVLALFGASAGGHLTSLAAASNLNTLAGDLAMSAGLILGRDISSNTAFRDHITSNLKLTGEALTAANAWLDGQLNAGAARGDMVATAVTFLLTLTDTTSPFFAAAQTFNTTVAAAVTWSTGAGATTFGVSALRAQQGNVDVVPGSSFVLTTATDTLVGTAGNDEFTGTRTTWAAGDSVVDGSTTDNDVYNLSVSSADLGDHRVSNVENVNITIASTSAPDTVGNNGGVRADSFAGVKNLTVTRADITLGGETIVANKAVQVVNLRADRVAEVTVGTGTKTVIVEQATRAGVVVNANNASGAASGSDGVQVIGAVTLNADNATGTINIDALGDSTEDAKNVTVKAAKANSVDIEAFTGVISVDAAAATTVTLAGVSGGATVNAAKSTNTTVSAIDDSGVTLNLGTYTRTAKGDVNLDGTTLTTDAATISAAGFITVDTKGGTGTIESISLSGNGAALTATIDSSSDGMRAITVTGSQNVRVEANSDDLAGVTVTNTGTGDLTVALNSALTSSGSTAIDFSKIAAKTLEFAADINNDANSEVQVASGSSIVISADQTDVFINAKTTKASLSIATGDDTLSSTTGLPSGATVEISTGILNVDTNVDTLNIDATTGKLLATAIVGGATSGVATTVVNITGTKDVTFSSTTGGDNVARSINAANFSGKLNMYVGATADVTTGSGIDTIRLTSGTTAYTLNTGAGNDAITVTAVAAATLVAAGSGNDNITIADADAIVVTGGDGNDTVTINSTIDTNGVFAGGEGSDTLKFAQTGASVNLSDNTNFAFSGFETVDVTALNSASNTITMNHAQVGTQTFTLTGNSVDDILIVLDKDAVGSASSKQYTAASSDDVIDMRNVTVNDAEITVQLGQGSNTAFGSSDTNDTLDVSKLHDVIDKNATTNTAASTGVVVNMGTSTISDSTLAAWGGYVPNHGSGIASGKAAYLFASTTTAATSSNAINTFSGFENVTGSGGADYIVGNADANIIVGGAGADYIDGGAGADLIGGGDGADTILGGAGADNIDGGAGADTYVYVTTAAASGGTPSDSLFESLSFVSSEDIIDIAAGAIVITGGVASGTAAAAAGNAATSTAGLATFHSDDDTLAERIVAVAADLDGTAAVREAAVFVHSSQAYLFISDGTAGLGANDILIKLTGITAVTTGITLTDGNITAIA